MVDNTDAVTDVLPIDLSKLHKFSSNRNLSSLDDWCLDLEKDSSEAAYLHRAASELRESTLPVAFPTETVYGLGADATRSEAVLGIYKAKQRPSDNPLIVHFHSLNQLRHVLRPAASLSDRSSNGEALDPIPEIYMPLIEKFWPGPLTMLMPNPSPSHLAPEVTAGLPTFGARIPQNILALALIKITDRPLAAPSANASTKPSPTAAEHVRYDLNGRITTILDGGACDVGVESTVVDGLSSPPVILRPGGITLEQLRACPGWEHVQIGYQDAAQSETAPRAPGMKYKHYSPKALVVLYEHGSVPPTLEDVFRVGNESHAVGIIRTRDWKAACGLTSIPPSNAQTDGATASSQSLIEEMTLSSGQAVAKIQEHVLSPTTGASRMRILDVSIGPTPQMAARGLFSALRLLDLKNVDAILVEGLDESPGDVTAAVMNRLRKAAEIQVAAPAATPGP